MSTLRRGFVSILCAPLLLAAPMVAQDLLPRAARTARPIQLDGILSEPEWATADSITDFRQRDPKVGEPSTERTVVRLLATPTGLAISWRCDDREPGRIVRSVLRRDQELRADDYVSVAIDGLRDRRSGFYFRVNANGALWDGEHINFEQGNEDWDGVWDARSKVTDQGYVVEMLIPWATLRYRRKGSEFVMNFRRFIRRKNEESMWRSWKRTEGFRFLETAGTVAGFDSLPARPRVEVRPYLLSNARLADRTFLASGGDSITAPSTASANIGLDVKIPVTNTLTADITVNPDFAQAEVDRQIVNLTRFPLFFPEQRPFFTEGAGIFEFGRIRQTQLFYSRRIGLGAGGVPVQIPFGVRVQGRAGSNQLGLLAMGTGDAEDARNVVVRGRHDVLGRGFVGGMATLSERPSRPGSVAGGVDFNLPYIVGNGQNLIVLGNAAWSRDSIGGATGGHYRLIADYPNDNADIVVRFDRVESGYNPALGFVQQRGIHRLGGSTSWTPRPRRQSRIRRYEFDFLSYDVVWSIGGPLSNASFEVKPLGLQLQNGDRMELNLQRRMDAPDEAFDLIPGTAVAPGAYWWNRVEAQYDGNDARPLRWSVNASAGDFYDGRSTELSGSLRLRRTPHVLAVIELARADVSLRGAQFTANTVRVRTDYAFSPRLNSTLFAQWDNQSSRASVNARVRWTVKPGSDLYVVWNSTWPSGLENGIPWRRPQRGGVVVKFVSFARR
jgi:hypothetical protein